MATLDMYTGPDGKVYSTQEAMLEALGVKKQSGDALDIIRVDLDGIGVLQAELTAKRQVMTDHIKEAIIAGADPHQLLELTGMKASTVINWFYESEKEEVRKTNSKGLTVKTKAVKKNADGKPILKRTDDRFTDEMEKALRKAGAALGLL